MNGFSFQTPPRPIGMVRQFVMLLSLEGFAADATPPPTDAGE